MRTAVVVLGNSIAGRDGAYRISRRCLRLVGAAEQLVEQLDADVVIFSGWSPDGGPSEAEQMRDAWRGRDVELVVEPSARSTAENAARTLPLAVEHGVGRAVVVCAPVHLFRARFFFRRLFEPRGIATEFRAARIVPSASALVWEVAAHSVRGRQLRAAERELSGR